MNKWPENQGFTLVETLVGLGLSLIVVWIIQDFNRKMSAKEATDQGRDAAKQTNQTLFSLIKRDLTYQIANTLSPDGFTLNVTRKQLYKVGAPQANYTVTYKSSCQTIASPNASTVDFLNKIYSGANSSELMNSKNKCLPKIACKPGQFPQAQIQVSATGPNIPVYTRRLFPDPSKDMMGDTIGVALCVDVALDRLRIKSDTIYALDRVKGTIRILSEEIVLPKNASTAMDMLPD